MIEIQKVKDDVALKNGFNKWQGVIQYLRGGLISYQELDKLENEVISEVAKQVAEAQKMICANKSRAILGLRLNTGKPPKHTAHIDKESILNAPSPEII